MAEFSSEWPSEIKNKNTTHKEMYSTPKVPRASTIKLELSRTKCWHGSSSHWVSPQTNPMASFTSDYDANN
jgi:hypothetical protein